jgi:hypothetical protein
LGPLSTMTPLVRMVRPPSVLATKPRWQPPVGLLSTMACLAKVERGQLAVGQPVRARRLDAAGCDEATPPTSSRTLAVGLLNTMPGLRSEWQLALGLPSAMACLAKAEME